MAQKQSNTASQLPEHGPLNEEGKEVLLSLKNVDITFGKGDDAVRAVKPHIFPVDFLREKAWHTVMGQCDDLDRFHCFEIRRAVKQSAAPP